MAITFIPRLYSRFQVHHEVHYLTPDSIGRGTLLDLSLRGCRLLGECPSEAGTPLTLRLMLPDCTDGLVLDGAKIRWVREQAFGLEFPRLLPAQTTLLRKVIQGLVGRPPEIIECQ